MHAQTSAVASHSEVEDLRQTVRELAQRVNALEQELLEQRTAGGTQSGASVRTAAFIPSVLDIRGSVESLSSNSAAAEIAPAPVAGTQTVTTQSAPPAPVLPTQLPGGATLNYMFDGYYDYDFNHPIGAGPEGIYRDLRI